MASCCSDLPEDVVSDKILPMLPIASLFRLRCVSKAWLLIIRRIILGSLFPSEDGAVDSSELIIQVVDKTFQSWPHTAFWKHFFSLSYDNLDLRFSLTPHPSLDNSLRAHDRSNEYLGSVNGIIVFHDSSTCAVSMWNPATNSYMISTEFIMPIPDPNDDDPFAYMCNFDEECFGCGFCAQSEDIKVVVIRSFTYWFYPCNWDESVSDDNEVFSDASDAFVYMDDDNLDEIEDFLDASDDFVDSVSDSKGNDNMSERVDPIRDLNLQPDYIVEVYCVSTDSWRRVDVDAQIFLQFPTGSSTFYPQQGYTNNTFSWLVISHGNGDPPVVKLLTFYMATEVFQVTSVPDAILGGSSSTYYSIYGSQVPGNPGRVPFQLMNGTICLAIPSHDQSFDIWLLLEYGVMDSWTRLCTFGPFPEVRQILGFWKNGKLFLESISGELFLADLFTNKIIQNLHIEGLPGYSLIIPHKETHIVLKENL